MTNSRHVAGFHSRKRTIAIDVMYFLFYKNVLKNRNQEILKPFLTCIKIHVTKAFFSLATPRSFAQKTQHSYFSNFILFTQD